MEMKTLRSILAVLLAFMVLSGPTIASAAGETVTVTTNATTYQGSAIILVTGTVSPPPASSGTAVVVTTTGPMGAVDIAEAPVAGTSGAFNYSLVTGGTPQWVGGVYTVNATYGGPTGTGSGAAIFTYSAAPLAATVTVTSVSITTQTSTITSTVRTTVTASPVTSVSTTTQTSTATNTLTVTSTATVTGGAKGATDFAYLLTAAAIFILAVAGSYRLIGRGRRVAVSVDSQGTQSYWPP